ncbi:MAG: hypothetical protein AAF346_06610 [Pseudomonadota bacterium]
MRFCLIVLWFVAGLQPVNADTSEQMLTSLRAFGVKVALSKRASLNRRSDYRQLVRTDEPRLVRDLAEISRKSALEEAYIHINDSLALETGVMERFEITPSDCLVRATVRSSVTVGLLAKLPSGLPEKIVWYHIHPSRSTINARFRAKRCAPPNTWPVLPSSADFSQFLKRAKRYYAIKPDGSYTDRIVIHPVGVIELALTAEGRDAIHKFKLRSNYDTQEYGNDSMPGHTIWPQKYIQRLNMLIDRIPEAGAQLDRNVGRAVDLLSSKMVRVTFTPLAKFRPKP